MKYSKPRFIGYFIVFLLFTVALQAQIPSGIYVSDTGNERHELKIDGDYMIYNIYKTSPATFIKTVGGFFTTDSDVLKVTLEFNSDYEKDKLKQLEIPFTIDNELLTLNDEPSLVFLKLESLQQDLDGQWLFATRGPDTGQERRGEENPRKTLKFLMDGHFQWIAYHTETMRFSGTGGGSYTAENGVYTENIEFFSRDNSRVGASLNFNYEIKGNDWHHTGKNSKGEPMYEIWAKRN